VILSGVSHLPFRSLRHSCDSTGWYGAKDLEVGGVRSGWDVDDDVFCMISAVGE
jgi:hypothetical protein